MQSPTKFVCHHKARTAGLGSAPRVRSQGHLGCSLIANFLAFSLPLSTIFAVTSVVLACRRGQTGRSGARCDQIRCCCARWQGRPLRFALLRVKKKMMATTKLIGLPLIGLSGVLIVPVLTTRRNFRPHLVISMLDSPPARELIASGKVETKGRVVELLIQRISVYLEYMETTCEQGGLSVNIKSWRSRADQKEAGTGKEADEERRKTEDLKNLRSTTTEEWKKQRCKGEGWTVLAFLYVARCKLPSVIPVCMALLLSRCGEHLG